MREGSAALPAGWIALTLDEATEIAPSASVDDFSGTHLVHFVPMASAKEEFEGIDVSSLRPLSEVRKGYTSFEGGDVLLAKITPCMENGKGGLVPKLTNKVAYGSTEFHVLRPKVVEGEWLAHYLSQPAFRKVARANMTGTAGQMRVPTKWLRTVEMPIPPRTEQTRIVEKLEELLSDLDAGVAELRAAQKKLAQYRQSLLKAAVEGALTAEWRKKHPPQETGAQLLARILTERRQRWETQQLAKFKAQGKTPPKDWQKKYPEPVQPETAGLPKLPQGWVWASVDQLSPDDISNGRSVPTAQSGAKVLRLTALVAGAVDLREAKCGDWSAEDAAPFAVADDDLLIARGNGSLRLVGRAGLVSGVTEPVAYPDTMIRLRLVDAVVRAAWVGMLWDSQLVRQHLESRARTSAGIYKISQPDITSVCIPIPPLGEQDELVLRLDEASREVLLCEESVNRVEQQSTAQRQNLLRAAFSGQLVPQDPNDEPASVLLERIRAERAVQGDTKKPRGRKAKEAP